MERARLAAIPLFEGLTEQELDAVAHAASELEVAAGDALVTEGEFGHALFAVEGRLG